MYKIEIISLSLRNFASYGNNTTVVNLERPGTTLIMGENLDVTTEGASSNGTGKTSLLNALTFVLYDKTISDISKDNLINNINKKNMEVAVNFKIGSDLYVIKRERKAKNGNNVYLYVNGEDKTLDSASNTNSRIEEILGITYDLFTRIVVFSASHIPFLNLTKSEQSSMFERLVGLTILSDKATSLKELIKETETSIQLKKSKIDALEREHSRHEVQIVNAKDRMDKWVATNNNEISELTTLLGKITGIDLDEQQTLHEELTLINSQLTQQINLLENIENRITGFNKQINKDTKELDHLTDNKCPYCLQSFMDVAGKIANLENHIIELNENINLSTQELDKVDLLIEELEIARDSAVKLLTTPNIRELLRIKSQSDSMVTKLELLKVAINPHIDSYQELINTILEKINYDDINKLSTEVDHQKVLLKLLTKKDSFVRRALLNKYIPYLNTRLQHYLSDLGLPHRVEFTHEMTAKISQFGRGLDFGNLSAGQRARVNLSLSMAFSDVLQSLHAKVNICFLDEVLDIGLDAIGAKSAAKLLKNKSKEDNISVYIISHKEEIESAFDHTLVIQMSKGFSYIKDNDIA